MIKNPPANAGTCGFDPWSGKIPHATGRSCNDSVYTQISPNVTNTFMAFFFLFFKFQNSIKDHVLGTYLNLELFT